MLFALFTLCVLSNLGFSERIHYKELDLDEKPMHQFRNWKHSHKKSYSSYEEELTRYIIFRNNLNEIHRRNAKNRTITLAPNTHMDLTFSEFQARYLGYNRREKTGYFMTQKQYLRGDMDAIQDLPSSVDWVTAGAVTPVKNQGQCGSCWSFSTTGAVEGAWFLAKGVLESLSEQQLVDCSTAQGNQGCNGGMMDDAFQYIITNGGICSEAKYPYQAADGTCQTCSPVATLHSYVDVQPNNETALMIAVARQPVSVAVEADGFDWQFYSTGVVTDSCGTNLDHGVLVVGYGTDPSAGDYWLVKNSWGPDWGESGYIRLGRGSKYAPNGECGILMDPSYPVV